MHKLESRIKDANARGRYALVPFLTAGFPTREKFRKALSDLENSGADIVEIGVPFSDPVADGPVVEEASRRVLSQGMNLAEILKELKERQNRDKTGIVLMGYLNPFLQYGFEKLAKDASEAGVEGFIVPDLPYEEEKPLKKALARYDIALIPLVGPNTTPERMELYAKEAQGYVYVVSVMGITGERKKVASHVGNLIDRVKKVFKVPVALGFGLSSPEQLKILPDEAQPDAAIFGSALLTHLDKGKSAKEFMAPWITAEKPQASGALA